jgi:hypothetical protein
MAFGLHHIVSAVSFLNNDCKLVRLDLSEESVMAIQPVLEMCWRR